MNVKKCLIIAEAGVNHNGELSLALKLCDEAKKAGADVVKFQTWKTENLITRNVEQAEYQKENTKQVESQFDMLKKLELSYDDFRKIKQHCDEIGIIFASTADDPESLDFLIDLGIPFIKVGSGDIGNVSFLRYMGTKHLPIILSTGMSNLACVELSLESLREGGAEDITLLHCTTSYPCLDEDVNLKAMPTLRDAFKLNVGYSDHTLGYNVAIAAVALGACVIEKHFTLDKNMNGPDHKASINPDELLQLTTSIRKIEIALGNGVKSITNKESKISEVVLKRIVAKRAIQKGQVISENDICVKRNDIGLPCNQWDEVIGTVAKNDYEVDDGII